MAVCILGSLWARAPGILEMAGSLEHAVRSLLDRDLQPGLTDLYWGFSLCLALPMSYAF